MYSDNQKALVVKLMNPRSTATLICKCQQKFMRRLLKHTSEKFLSLQMRSGIRGYWQNPSHPIKMAMRAIPTKSKTKT
jgi:hypothetical protein